MAADAPRWRVIAGLDVAIEATTQPQTVSKLADMGHRVMVEPDTAGFGFGGAQLIRKIGDVYIAGSDPRKDGMAAGF